MESEAAASQASAQRQSFISHRKSLESNLFVPAYPAMNKMAKTIAVHDSSVTFKASNTSQMRSGSRIADRLRPAEKHQAAHSTLPGSSNGQLDMQSSIPIPKIDHKKAY